MAKKIDFILPQTDRFSINAMMTKWIAHGVQQNHSTARLITPPLDRNKPEKFLSQLLESPPACTFCVNGILPDKAGNFLADLVQIPHIAYVVDAPTIYYGLCNSDFTILATVDTEFQNIFSEVKRQEVIFLPGAAPDLVEPVPGVEERPFDILMMPHLIDPSKLHEEWTLKMPKKMVQFLEDCARMTLSTPSETFTSSFLKGFEIFSQQEQNDFNNHRSLPLIHELEMYIRGLEQLELLKAVDGLKVQLLVPHGTVGAWKKILDGIGKNFTFIEGLEFDTIYSALKESKIFIQSSPQMKYGTDGWPLVALLAGCYVFSSPNNWLKGRYNENSGIYYYNYKDAKAIRAKAEHLLNHPKEMEPSILHGRNKVIQQDTWKARAKQLLDDLPTYLTPLAAKGRSKKAP